MARNVGLGVVHQTKEDGSLVEFRAVIFEKGDGTFRFIPRSEPQPCTCPVGTEINLKKGKADVPVS